MSRRCGALVLLAASSTSALLVPAHAALARRHAALALAPAPAPTVGQLPIRAQPARPRAPPARLAVLGPSWLSLLPPLVTLVASVSLRQVILAMLLGIWSGSLLLNAANPLTALLRTFDHYMVGAIVDAEHAGVVLFTMLLGGTIGLVQKSGGALGLAKLVRRFFTSRRTGALSTIGLGSLVFFDDYSSILIVGNSLRPLLAAVRMSAAKFAFVAHVMGTCLASLAPISSWVGLEIGYVSALYTQLGGKWASLDPFVGLMQTIRFRFLPLTMLGYIVVNAISCRDFGPMLDAEKAAASAPSTSASPGDTDEVAPEMSGPLAPDPGIKRRAKNALIPFGAVMGTAFAGMVAQGVGAIRALPLAGRPAVTLVNCLRYADSVTALLWGSVFGWLASLGLVLSQRILSLPEAMTAWGEGIKEVVEPVIVLLLAWALGAVIADVGTAQFLAGSLQAGLPAWSLPALISLICYAVSFATGSAFGTMAILFPLVGPLAASVSAGSIPFMQKCLGATLGGSIFGNICSPIADTTILTALSTRVDLAEHVRTALPYTLLVGAVALVCGDLACGLGLGAVPALALCVGVTSLLQIALGKRVES